MRWIFTILWEAVKEFFRRKALRLSAGLSFYTVFSLPGLLIIVIWISDFFYGRAAVEGTIYGQINAFVGSDTALMLQDVIRNASTSGDSKLATITGIATLVLGAGSIFGELQDSLNQLWHLKPVPKEGRGWIKLILNRLLSFSMLVSLGFLMLVSLLINGLLDLLSQQLQLLMPHLTYFIMYSVNLLVSFAITALLFAIIFKVLPDARIRWKQVWIGAACTTLFFMLGKFLIAFYLGQNRLSSAYGAAGSVIVLLLWVYYSSAILYFGAVFTRLYASYRGAPIEPSDYAVWVKQIELERPVN